MLLIDNGADRVIRQAGVTVSVNTVLVRYCEIGLKSTPVRRRFESQLKDNMLSMLAADGVEALISQGEARFYLESDDPQGCIASMRKVFGIASVSLAERCTSDLDDICATAAEFSRGRIPEGAGFAVRARREGTHPYTSMEVGKIAGSAVSDANPLAHVDLTSPDVTIYVEVRNNRAYIFDSYVNCPGGLPLGTQGKVYARAEGMRGELSAWMMMKRGCRVVADTDATLLRMYDPSLKTSDRQPSDSLGIVYGNHVSDVSGVDWSGAPVYLPTVAMSDDAVEEMYARAMRAEF